ncbi:MAG: lantibiotic export permease, partial [bacterium]
MLAVLSVEIRKLNRSLAVLLAVAAPSLIAIFAFFNLMRGKTPQPWEMWMVSSIGIWAFFMLPMSVTALTALVAHMEHGPKSWDHLRSLPLPRWRLYAAKAIVVLAVVAIMSAATLLLTWGAVTLATTLKPNLTPTGSLDIALYATTMGKVFLAAILMVAIQLWAALRFASFVPALVLGIGGTHRPWAGVRPWPGRDGPRRRPSGPARGALVAGGRAVRGDFGHGGLEIVLLAQLFDQLVLGLEEVDVLFRVGEYLGQDLAADEVGRRLALGDPGQQGVAPAQLQRQVRAEAFEDVLADLQLVQILH